MQSISKAIRSWGREFILFLVTLAFVAVGLYVVFIRPYQPVSGLSAVDKEKIATVQQSAPVEAKKPALVTPVRLIMPSINVALDIDDSTIDLTKNNWPLSDDKVHYANFTPQLGAEKGTMLLYGHNTPQLLRPTADLKIGDKITLVDTEGASHEFVYESQRKITPEQTEFIYEDTPFRIVMFTCDGWGDQYRRLMYFSPV